MRPNPYATRASTQVVAPVPQMVALNLGVGKRTNPPRTAPATAPSVLAA